MIYYARVVQSTQKGNLKAICAANRGADDLARQHIIELTVFYITFMKLIIKICISVRKYYPH